MAEVSPEKVERLIARIKPMLAGHDPGVQSAVLADLLATWLAGHVVVGDPAQTRALREHLLAHVIGLVRRLTKVNARLLGTDNYGRA